MVGLTPQPLDIPALRSQVADPAAGAILVFEGTVRNHSEGLTGVIALEYEAHPTMAQRVLAEIVAAAHQSFPIAKAAVWHRLGRVELGEPTIAIAVSAAHRDEAYRASRYIIDRIKHEAPIWKREICADGTSGWSRGCTAHSGHGGNSGHVGG
ncbi:MAG: molybdenum cofactor biosynthesis protein MoaE [Fibrobacteres bacterium]|nr:molybdenum cofactor biosynthesis protein MoaE [Fibrobacterota bacterium]